MPDGFVRCLLTISDISVPVLSIVYDNILNNALYN
jgi:hypothetical protein